ncbi:MAG: GTPase RsgA, partial [Frankiales bacterium]
LAPYARPGTTLVLLGASGAGKSTVVNALAGATVMDVGDVRGVDGKGRRGRSPRSTCPRRRRPAAPAWCPAGRTARGPRRPRPQRW